MVQLSHLYMTLHTLALIKTLLLAGGHHPDPRLSVEVWAQAVP